jgi:hypothetical protein
MRHAFLAAHLRGAPLPTAPPPQVQEADESWDPDIILTEVASAINAEREKADTADGPSGDDAALAKEDGLK